MAAGATPCSQFLSAALVVAIALTFASYILINKFLIELNDEY
jgi:hypothetical protein